MLLLKISFIALYEKEEEFKQVLNTLSSIIPSLKTSQQILNTYPIDGYQFSLVQEFDDRKTLDEFLASSGFRQIVGAFTVLGKIVDAKLYESSLTEPLSDLINFLEPVNIRTNDSPV